MRQIVNKCLLIAIACVAVSLGRVADAQGLRLTPDPLSGAPDGRLSNPFPSLPVQRDPAPTLAQTLPRTGTSTDEARRSEPSNSFGCDRFETALGANSPPRAGTAVRNRLFVDRKFSLSSTIVCVLTDTPFAPASYSIMEKGTEGNFGFKIYHQWVSELGYSISGSIHDVPESAGNDSTIWRISCKKDIFSDKAVCTATSFRSALVISLDDDAKWEFALSAPANSAAAIRFDQSSPFHNLAGVWSGEEAADILAAASTARIVATRRAGSNGQRIDGRYPFTGFQLVRDVLSWAVEQTKQHARFD